MPESSPGANSINNNSVELVTRANPAGDRALVEPGDIRLTALLPLLAGLAWFAPQKHWPWLCRNLIGPVSAKGSSQSIPRGVAAWGQGERLAVSPARINAELNANRLETYLQYLRDYRPGGWNIHYSIEGRAGLDAGIGSGRGVILWIAHNVFNGIALKKGLAGAGYAVSHLSRPEHGFSSSRYGIAALNPIRSHIETRYLKQRIIIRREAEHLALLSARKLLRAGEIVSITAGAWEGTRIARAPLGKGFLPLAVGAPALAHMTGACLLPVFIARDGNVAGTNGGEEKGDRRDHYTITLGERIDCSGPDRDGAICSATADYVRQLEPRIAANPGQWRGWKYLQAE